MKLWYTSPATHWMTSALPIGNGELGALFFGRVAHERIQFNEKTLWTGDPTKRGAYQSFGDVYLHFEGIDTCTITRYERELSLNNAVGRVSFMYNGVNYHRSYFASHPDSLIVIHLCTSGDKEKLNFSVSLEDARESITEAQSNNVLLMQNQLDL